MHSSVLNVLFRLNVLVLLNVLFRLNALVLLNVLFRLNALLLLNVFCCCCCLDIREWWEYRAPTVRYWRHYLGLWTEHWLKEKMLLMFTYYFNALLCFVLSPLLSVPVFSLYIPPSLPFVLVNYLGHQHLRRWLFTNLYVGKGLPNCVVVLWLLLDCRYCGTSLIQPFSPSLTWHSLPKTMLNWVDLLLLLCMPLNSPLYAYL